MILLKCISVYVILNSMHLIMKGVTMQIRRNDGFHLTFSSILTGLFLGLALLPLTIFIATVPYYACVALPIFLALPALFLLLFIPYLFILVSQCRRKRYATLLFSGIISFLLPLLAAIIFTFAYPHVPQILFKDLLETAIRVTGSKPFPATPAAWHYLFGLLSILPGTIASVIQLTAYGRKKRRRDTEYHQPKKKNYYYI